MTWSQWRNRAQYQSLKLRGPYRWTLAWAGLILGIILTTLLVAASAYFEALSGSSLWWKVAGGFALFFVGVAGNVAANSLQDWLDNRPRDAAQALANHDLAGIVGESLRVLLLLLVDSKPPPDGMTPEDFPQYVTPPAKAPLTDMAAAATDFWRGLVVEGPPERLKPYAGLHEPSLSAFVMDSRARAMDPHTWSKFLNELNTFARLKTGQTDPPFANNDDRNATVEMLETQFGRSFREALKWDFSHDGLGWAAMQLQIAGQLLARLGGATAEDAALRDAIANLRDAYDRGFKTLIAKVDMLESANKRRHKKMVAGLIEHHKKVMYKLSAISADTARLPGIERTLQSVADRLAPKLTLPIKGASGNRDRFIFRSEHLTVVGRDTELAELYAWLNKPAAFGWDLWTGPAGSGKSRLALELCRRRPDWKSGFYNWASDNTPDWTLWDPKSDTIIIFDYVAEHATEIGDILAILAARSAPCGNHPLRDGVRVRCLLLERAAALRKQPSGGASAGYRSPISSVELEPDWLVTLRQKGKACGQPFVTTHARQNADDPVRFISGVGREAVLRIIREDAALGGETPTDEQVTARADAAQSIDPFLRPLFVAMVAEAVREQGESLQIDWGRSHSEALVDYIRDKEWKHACERLDRHPSGRGPDQDAWARMLCLSTMCNDLSGDELTKALRSEALLGLPNEHQWGDGSRFDLLVSGAREDHAPKLEPDVLGEGFVVWWLGKHRRQSGEVIRRAWELGMNEFVSRAAQDFPDGVQAVGLLDPQPNAQTDALGAAHHALASREVDQGNYVAVAQRGARLLLDKGQPPQIRLFGVSLWTEFSDPKELDTCRAAVDILSAADILGGPIAGHLAYVLNNAVFQAGEDRDLAHSLLVELNRLAQALPYNETVRNHLASRIYGEIWDFYEELEDPLRVDRLLGELRRLAVRHPDDLEVREYLAKSLVEAISRGGGYIGPSDRLLSELRTLAEMNLGSTAMRKQLASGLNYVICEVGEDADRSDRVLDELRTLAGKYTDETGLREQLARALNSAITHAGLDGPRADRLLDELRVLADEAGLREQLARGLNTAITHVGTDASRLDRLLVELRALAGKYSDETRLREQLARALNAAISHAGPDASRLDRLLDELRTLAERNSGETRLRGLLAWGLNDAIAHAGTDATRLDRLLNELRTLAERNSDEPELRELLAWGLTNAITHAGTDASRLDRLLSELRTLAKNYAEYIGLPEILAWGLKSAITHAGVDLPRSDRFLDELRNLAWKHPNDEEVQSAAFQACGEVFQRAFENGPLVMMHIEHAIGLVQRLPRDEEASEMVMQLLAVVNHIADKSDGEIAASVRQAGITLRQAIESHFDTSLPSREIK